MEQNLNDGFDSELTYFHLEYKKQNIKNNNFFQEWNKKANKYITEVNKRHEKLPKTSVFRSGIRFLAISFWNNCNCYVISSIENSYSSIKCLKCKKDFCPGCFESYNDKDSVCLKGYFKLLYLRSLNGRSFLDGSNAVINIIFIIFFLLFTPFYIGCVFSYIWMNPHPKKNNKGNLELENKKCKIMYLIIYSLLRGLLMFYYVIFFSLLLIVVLLPGIFLKKYFYRLLVFYLFLGIPGTYPLKNLEE